MLQEGKINGYQLGLLIMGFIFGSTAILTPATAARQDAWLAYIIGWGGGVFLMWLYCKISSAYPSKTLIDILILCFGRYLGLGIALLYIWYFIHLASLVLRNFGEYLAITIYFETPMPFTIIIFTLAIAYSLKKGLQVMGRAAEMLMPYLLIFVILTLLLVLTEYEVANMLPILERGVMPVAKASYGVLTFPFGEVVVFLMIFPSLYKPQILTRTAMVSVVVIGVLVLGVILRDLWTLGPDMLTRVTFPPSLSTKLIPEITLDPIVAVNLLVGGWIKIAVCIYAAALGITQLIQAEDSKPFVLPICAICVGTSIWVYENIFQMLKWVESSSYVVYVFVIQIAIPMLVFIILRFKKKKKSANNVN